MKFISDLLILIVAFEALFIMVLEMFFTQTKLARNAFDLSKEYLQQKEAKVSMANQGLYNGFIGIGIIISRFILPFDARNMALYLFIGFVIIAALYGAVTANKKIILSQGLPAIIALIALLVVNL
ncbi:DUF1304 domain-containing protein [Limosilactobacillus fermentum]|uniref:DUF1304 domain-containing protein n=1 Tax=Limosilactobacillus fermentum TaxID=1613 RepID=UPI00070ADBBC|nr:DUF1304 domain-containing protein [Limosilactobacillus fermentum]AMS08617.1 hypothetical protein AYI71_07380 [Limosilactobacillus oris]MCH5388893.1 DUF1304 domain-containing protein [Limosilactobacillus fermentum]MCH5393430.1 DUF1304 domain-containing protein [Limosilactobacillus fermentum]MCT3436362.1 DUF1304 domain-containing protein [Limosilactobacillus fermentum]PPX65054.1 DUF1304 domain-containing protein [Limosilactobacillus fermentum]